MKKYKISLPVKLNIVTTIEAPNEEEAISKATKEWVSKLNSTYNIPEVSHGCVDCNHAKIIDNYEE